MVYFGLIESLDFGYIIGIDGFVQIPNVPLERSDIRFEVYNILLMDSNSILGLF